MRNERGWRVIGWVILVGRFVGRSVRRTPERLTMQRLRPGQGLDVRTRRNRRP
ncbi:MAG: hypothetical protein VW552_07545 [Ilumatobacter sp.]